MRGVIVANGAINSPDFIRDALKMADYIICLDGGLRYCKRAGVRPDVIAGDFDSVSACDLEAYRTSGVEVISYPSRKDYTDMEIGINIARDKGINELFIIGALGKRTDHTLGNINNLILALDSGMKPVILDEFQDIYIIKDGIGLKRPPGTVISLIPFGDDVTGVRTEGLDYPLNGETLSLGRSRGISNVFINETAAVSIDKGILLIIVNKGRETAL